MTPSHTTAGYCSHMTQQSTHPDKPKDVDIRFIVTGFGPFDGVPDNPTTRIAQKLIEHLATKAMENGDISTLLSKLSNTTRTLVVETSAKDAKQQLGQLEEEMLLRLEGSATRTIMVLLHLGVSTTGTQFQLESYAYNNADFRMPDENGFQPQKEQIFLNHELDAPLETSLNVADLVAKLNQTHCLDPPAVASTDPGRFVCNYIYCVSLEKFQSSRRTNVDNVDKNIEDHNRDIPSHETASVNRKSPTCKSLFLHVPPFEQIPEAQQLDFVANLMVALYQQLNNVRLNS